MGWTRGTIPGHCTCVQGGILQARTLATAFERRGVGIHEGRAGDVRVEPAPWGTGLWAVVGGREIPVDLGHARAEAGSTVLVGPTAEWRTPEHLLAALVGCGITDARLVCEGPEAPALDGSAGPWVDEIRAAGVVGGPAVEGLRLQEPVRVEGFGGVAEAWPAEVGSAEVEVDFGPAGPRGGARVALDGEAFAVTTARARTFVLDRQVDALRAAGRGAGATAENTVVWRTDGRPTEGLRRPDEPIRHKLVDLVGDLALVGKPVCARVRVVRGSHRLHRALVEAMLGAR